MAKGYQSWSGRATTCLLAASVAAAALVPAGCNVVAAGVTLPDAFAHNGDLGLRGTIVDEQGQPVDQVLVNIDRTYYLWHADANYPEYSTQLVAADRTFQIGPMRAQQLTFTFKKPGYVEQKITVKQDNSIASGVSRGVRGTKWAGQDVRVVLPRSARESGSPLNELSAEVDFTDPNKNPAINLAVIREKASGRPVVARGGSAPARVSSTTPPRDAVVQMESLTNPPAGLLYAVIQRQPLRISGPNRQVDPLDVNLPARITFRMSDSDGGFLPFTPGPGSDILDQMSQAPEGGYAPELTLDAATLRKMRDITNDFILDRNVFFFFRAGGKYGKAIVNWSPVNGDAFSLSFTLLMQPDGSRVLTGG